MFASEHARLCLNLERCITSFDVADALRLNRERITADGGVGRPTGVISTEQPNGRSIFTEQRARGGFGFVGLWTIL